MADFIRGVFAANDFILLSIEGQVFFVLGLGIAAQYWRESRLELARSLRWLAAFGFLHAFYSWGSVFIPIQAGYLAEPFVDGLLLAQVILLGGALACLFQFGMQTFARPGNAAWHAYVVPVVLAAWIVWAIGPALYNASSMEAWHLDTTIWARYLLGFPGAIVAAIGLRSEAMRLIAPLRLPHIWQTLRVAGLALAGLSIALGLIVPERDFFPASLINEEMLFRIFVFPIEVYRAALGLVLAAAMVRAMAVFRTELDRFVAELQESEALAAERERFGRELHDGTLQVIYASGLLLRMTERRVADRIDEEDRSRLNESIGLLDRAVREIRQHLGQLQGVRPSSSLAAELTKVAAEPYLTALIDVTLDLELPDGPQLSPAHIAHIVAVTREAASNVVRHAQASHMTLSARQSPSGITISIADDGIGIPDDPIRGLGLRNMTDRVRILGGSLTTMRNTNPGVGTTVMLEVPFAAGGEDSATDDR